MSNPANDDELVNDDELLFERAPFPALADPFSTAPTSIGPRTSVPPPLPQSRTSSPTPAPTANREESRYPVREESRYPAREESRYPSHEDSHFPSPSREESRYPTLEDSRPAANANEDSRYPSHEESRYPSHEDSHYPSHIDELRFSRVDRSAQDERPLQTGDVVAGKYRVERIVGRIGVGIVAQVRHADLGQRFRLKYLPLEACEAPDAVSRFLRGARRAMRLQSEHTARTIDAGRLPSGAPYVVTEANAGSDLREVMRVRGVLTPNEAVDFVLQAAESLAEAHARGLIHKNLNLSTLFVTWRPDGSHSIKVQDFGVAESLRADPLRSSDLNGEPVTMFDANPLESLGCLSPEQIRGNPEIDGAADVWALGCILHQLLTGFPPFSATTVAGLLAAIAADPATPITAVRSDVPAGLESVISRCLEKNRGARFPSLADLGSALRRFASPDAQASADRITRTLGRAQQAPFGIDRQRDALVYVGPAIASQAPSVADKVRAASLPYPVLWTTMLLALGLLGGALAGVLLATRLPVQRVALEPQFNALQPAPSEPLNAPPVSLKEAPTLSPPVVQPSIAAAAPATTAVAVVPPVDAPAVRAALPASAPPHVVLRAKPAAPKADMYDLGNGNAARSSTKTSQPSSEAASGPTTAPASEPAQTANLGKDLFEGVR